MARKTTTAKAKAAGTAKAEPWVPTLAEVLETMAGHVAHMMTRRPGESMSHLRTVEVGCGIGGYEGTDCPLVILSGTITAVDDSDGREVDAGGPWGEWAQVELNGRKLGNRWGAKAEIARAYAPVIAWVAAYHARKAAAELVAGTPRPELARAAG